MRCACIVVDMQRDFFEQSPALLQKKPRLVRNINELTEVCRRAGTPVLWVRQEFEADLSDAFPVMRREGIRKTIRGTAGCALLDGLNREPNEPEIIKKRYSAFFRTELEQVLRNLGVETVILSGINTHACIRMAAIDAYQRDFGVVLAEDCVASYDEEFHRESLRYLTRTIARTATNGELAATLAGEAALSQHGV